MKQEPSGTFLENPASVDTDIEAASKIQISNIRQLVGASILSVLIIAGGKWKGEDFFEYYYRNIAKTRVTQTLSLPPTSSGGQSDDMVAIEMFLTTAMGLAAENSLGGFSTDIPINYDDDLVELAVKWFFGADPYTRKFILEAALSAMK